MTLFMVTNVLPLLKGYKTSEHHEASELLFQPYNPIAVVLIPLVRSEFMCYLLNTALEID